ncbi:MAG TPA: SulP family inorganic anion transporter [Actinomycetes bacterium]|nr:SulP family inorganic anion transporter [Actinomycetes bacterium]
MTESPVEPQLRPFARVYGHRSPFAHASKPPLIRRYLPFVISLRGYDAKRSRQDVSAGLTVMALALPSAMAFADLAGLPVSAGLYALLLPVLAYAILGSYRRLVVGPESTVSILVASSLAPMVVGDPARYAALAAALAIIVGCVYLLAWVARLGWIADYFSQAVLVGYITGVAIVLIVAQSGKLIGFTSTSTRTAEKAWDTVSNVGEGHPGTALIGFGTILILIVMGRFAPKVPTALLVVVISIGLSWWLDFASYGVAVVGHVPAGLPSLQIPDISGRDIASLIGPALAIFVVSFSDSILVARSFAMRHRESVKVDQEMLALGVGNITAGFSQSLPISTSSSRTAVNDPLATSQVSGLVAATGVLVVLLFFTEPMQYLPEAVLGAIIIYAAARLIRPGSWRALRRSSRAEVVIAATATITVVLFGVLPGLAVAVLLSILDVIRRSARPPDAVLGYSATNQRWSDVTQAPDALVVPGIVVYRLGERLFFANAHYVKRRIWAAVHGAPPPIRWFIFDAGATSDIDASAQAALHEVVESLRDAGTGFALARAHSGLVHDLETVGLIDLIGTNNIYPTVGTAVAGCELRSKQLLLQSSSGEAELAHGPEPVIESNDQREQQDEEQSGADL